MDHLNCGGIKGRNPAQINQINSNKTFRVSHSTVRIISLLCIPSGQRTRHKGCRLTSANNFILLTHSIRFIPAAYKKETNFNRNSTKNETFLENLINSQLIQKSRRPCQSHCYVTNVSWSMVLLVLLSDLFSGCVKLNLSQTR